MADYNTDHGVKHRIAVIKKQHVFLNGQAGDFPTLHGPHIKAANTRCALPFAASLAARYITSSDLVGMKTVVAVQSLNSFVNLLYSSVFFF